jgi:hypothetical protein
MQTAVAVLTEQDELGLLLFTLLFVVHFAFFILISEHFV